MINSVKKESGIFVISKGYGRRQIVEDHPASGRPLTSVTENI